MISNELWDEIKLPIKPPGLQKIGDIKPPCCHPEHNPPSHLVQEDGIYEYTCPGCGHSVQYTIHRPTM